MPSVGEFAHEVAAEYAICLDKYFDKDDAEMELRDPNEQLIAKVGAAPTPNNCITQTSQTSRLHIIEYKASVTVSQSTTLAKVILSLKVPSTNTYVPVASFYDLDIVLDPGYTYDIIVTNVLEVELQASVSTGAKQ